MNEYSLNNYGQITFQVLSISAISAEAVLVHRVTPPQERKVISQRLWRPTLRQTHVVANLCRTKPSWLLRESYVTCYLHCSLISRHFVLFQICSKPDPQQCPLQHFSRSPTSSTAHLWLCVCYTLSARLFQPLSTIISEMLPKLSPFNGLLCFCFQLFLLSVLGIIAGDSIGPCSNLLVSFHFKLMTIAGSAKHIQPLWENFLDDIYRALGAGETTVCCKHQFSSLMIFSPY